MPIISPFKLISGPPEHPGLIAASVWILFLSWSILEIIPVVRVSLKPKGQPIVKTLWPTLISSELPNFARVRFSFVSILINAKSFLFFKIAKIFALYSFLYHDLKFDLPYHSFFIYTPPISYLKSFLKCIFGLLPHQPIRHINNFYSLILILVMTSTGNYHFRISILNF